VVGDLLELSGIGRNRAQLRWVSSAEGQLFAEYVSQYNRLTEEMGPFDAEKFKLPLAAVEQALGSARIRWLMGMARHLTEKGNVYGEKLKEEDYERLIQQAVVQEYEKALVFQALRQGVASVREISEKAGLPVYTVSLRLNELERCGQAELREYAGTTPRFMVTA